MLIKIAQTLGFSLSAALLLSACFKQAPEAVTTGQKISIQTYTAPDTGFLANSYLLYTKTEAILVDAQLTVSSARKIGTMIREVDKKLSTIFITHAHPDHYLGLEELAEQFPKAQIIARPQVVEEIQKTGEAKRSYWKPIYKDDLANRVIIPKAYSENQLTLGGTTIQIIDLESGESESGAMLYIPSLHTLITGDLIYGGVHLWLADEKSNIDGWLNNIKRAKKIEDLEVVLPGHGRATGVLMLEANESYLRRFKNIMQTTQSMDEAIGELRAAYPEYALPVIADMSVKARFKAKGPTPTTKPMVNQ